MIVAVSLEGLNISKDELERHRLIPPELMEAIEQRFRIEWTYNVGEHCAH